jgi:hypothetical protein
VGTADDLRVLSADDVPWVADTMASRRAVYATFSPIFWRPATNARELHVGHLASCVASDRYCGFRTDVGFILGELQDATRPPWWSDVPLVFVDDFAVTSDDRWPTDGLELLVATWRNLAERGAETMRVVTARLDTPKVEMLESSGLELAESWWVRPTDGPPSSAPAFGPVSSDGVEALVIPAPPVYDPGGPVLLVTALPEPSAAATVPAVAEECGAVLSILPTKPASPDAVEAARGAGFDEVSRYYTGRPSSR